MGFQADVFKVFILQVYSGGVMLRTAQKDLAHERILMHVFGLGISLIGFKSGGLDRVPPDKDGYLNACLNAEIIMQRSGIGRQLTKEIWLK